MPVAHARGTILLALTQNEIPIFEYTPMEVKKVLTGFSYCAIIVLSNEYFLLLIRRRQYGGFTTKSGRTD